VEVFYFCNLCENIDDFNSKFDKKIILTSDFKKIAKFLAKSGKNGPRMVILTLTSDRFNPNGLTVLTEGGKDGEYGDSFEGLHLDCCRSTAAQHIVTKSSLFFSNS
jgi:hypothetical protein